VTKKANSTLAVLRRNLHHCPRPTKSLCYLTLIRPLTDYSAVIWDPHRVENIRKLEMIQRRASRMVYADYQTTSSVSTMLSQLQWTTMQERRAQAKACMMYRVVNQLIDIPSQILVPTISSRGNNITFLVPDARTLIYQISFFPMAFVSGTLYHQKQSKFPLSTASSPRSRPPQSDTRSTGCF
jgi:hypothetical protein